LELKYTELFPAHILWHFIYMCRRPGFLGGSWGAFVVSPAIGRLRDPGTLYFQKSIFLLC
jgi:hypothetical protein